MSERVHAGKPAQITFTRDFHELVSGDLRPGAGVDIRYDPKRIVPDGEPYLFGDPGRPIVAHARFRDGDQPIARPLESQAGIVVHPDIDVTGQGSMLSTSFSVPENAERVTLWFSYPSAAGDTRYDSDYGANYCFGFPCRQIAVLGATVTGDPQASSGDFALSVAADAAVEEVAVRFYIVADPACAKNHANSATEPRKRPAGTRRLVGQRPGAAAGGRALQALLSSGSPPIRGRQRRALLSRAATRTGPAAAAAGRTRESRAGLDVIALFVSASTRNGDTAAPRFLNRGHH